MILLFTLSACTPSARLGPSLPSPQAKERCDPAQHAAHLNISSHSSTSSLRRPRRSSADVDRHPWGTLVTTAPHVVLSKRITVPFPCADTLVPPHWCGAV